MNPAIRKAAGLLLAALGLAPPVHAETRYVSLTGAHVPPFTSWADAATNIQDAVDVCDAGDVVLVTNGVYAHGGRTVYSATTTNRVVLDRPVVLQSVNGPADTVIRGAPAAGGGCGPEAVRCIYASEGCRVAGFTLHGGHTGTNSAWGDDSGGGIYCQSDVVVSNCVLTGCGAMYGGGGAMFGLLAYCSITSNAATCGAGAAASVLNHCLLTGNAATNDMGTGSGGGAYWGAMINCIVAGNRAQYGGGGVANAALTNCVLCDNVASNGGGAWAGTLANCVLSGNRATYGGGGALASALRNCIAVSNSSTLWPSTANYRDCEIAHTLTAPLCPGEGNLTGDPGFVDAGGGDYHLRSDSPCINAGDNAAAPASADPDGRARIIGNVVDMGAYEFPWPAIVITNPPHRQLRGWSGAAIALAGQANEYVVGEIVWTNEATGDAGTTAATPEWQASVSLGLGPNVLVVTVSNGVGVTAGTTVLVVRTEQIVGDSPEHFVAASGQAVWPYTNWTDAATSLQDAIDAAADGDTIRIGGGAYTAAGIYVGRSLVFDGPGAIVQASGVPGTATGRVFFFESGVTSTLRGLTIRHGLTTAGDGRGGGIYNLGNLTLENCSVMWNASQGASGHGGGIYHAGGRLEIIGGAVSENTTIDGAHGAGIYNAGGFVSLRGATIANNTNGYGLLFGSVLADGGAGGGLYTKGGTVICDGATLAGNCTGDGRMSGPGAGICARAADLVLTNCIVASNIVARFGNVADEGGSGGGISIGGGTALFIDCVVSGNRAGSGFPGGSGGGICATAAVVTLVDCHVTDNAAGYGRNPGAGSGGRGGGLYLVGESPVDLRGCTVSGNQGGYGDIGGDGGGVYHLGGALALSSCTLDHNAAGVGVSPTEARTGRGGGLYHEGGALVVTDSSVDENTAGDQNSGGQGGGFFATCSSVVVSNSTIRGNEAGGGYELDRGGAGLWCRAESLSLLECRVIANSLTRGGQGGGVHYEGGDMLLRGTEIADNTILAVRPEFLSGAGGGLFCGAGSLALVGGSISRNHAPGAGAGLYSLAATVASNVTLEGNVVDSGGDGGGICSAQGPLRLLNCRVLSNETRFASSRGGGVAHLRGDLACVGAEIVGNVAGGDGGGLLADSEATVAAFTNCVLDANRAGGNGGALCNRSASLTLIDSRVATNTAGYQGGGICDLAAAALVLDGCVVTDNRSGASTSPGSGSDGGGILNMGGALTLRNCTVASNESLNVGGAQAGNGGGISHQGGSAMLTDCLVEGNSTGRGFGGGDGGGLHLSGGPTLLAHTTVRGNVVGAGTENEWPTGNGAGLFASVSLLTVDHCQVTDNAVMDVADGWGGGVYFLGNEALVSDSEVSGNAGRKGGGGLCLYSGAMTIRGCRVERNRVEGIGGGLHNRAGTLAALNCLLSRNAAGEGGGAYGADLGNCTVVTNAATTYGAGVCLGTLLNCIVSGNGEEPTNEVSGTVAAHTCTTPLLEGEGNIDQSPAFRDAAGGDYRLAPVSPCIDAGLNQPGMETGVDLEGNPRIRNRTTDLGAYEFAFQGVLRVLLQGPYITGQYAMAVMPTNRLPRVSPYAASGDSISNAPAGCTDWVLVEVLDAASNTTRFARSALLQSNGSLSDPSGAPWVPLEVSPLTTNRLRISHRNHGSVLSAAALSFDALWVAADFTAANACAGGTNACVEVDAGVWAMRAGDVDGDGEVGPADLQIGRTQQGKN